MPTIHRTRSLKLYRAVSTLNPINRITVTASSLREAYRQLPAAVAITSWAPAQEVRV